jgi:hypothetical protein
MNEYTLKVMSARDISPIDGHFWLVEQVYVVGIYDVGVPIEYEDYGVYSRGDIRIHLWVHRDVPDDFTFRAEFPLSTVRDFVRELDL